jgi:hypothetical protein
MIRTVVLLSFWVRGVIRGLSQIYPVSGLQDFSTS